jgi:hypothetical protein
MCRRRAVLAALVGLTGCAGGARSDTTEDETTAEDTTTPESDTTRSPATTGRQTDTTGATTATTETTAGELDLREANVVGVAVAPADGAYRFDVTLIHDDDGEDGYANWWVVESLDGTELGRRELLHPHGTRAFTRSATVDTRGETCVVVRGHDQTHGYGGQVAVVSVETGATNLVDQGPDRRAVMAGACP